MRVEGEMDGLTTIMTRRSMRRFTDKPVDDAVVERVLRAAMAAPSAGNQQVWRFVVVHDRDVMGKLADASPYASMLPTAPLAIVVCAEAATEKHVGFWAQDCSAATENILLAAHALGLGAVWLGFYPVRERVEAAAEALGLPEEVTPMSVVPLGYPKEELPAVDRYDATYVHMDRW
jgi:nitroreductase